MIRNTLYIGALSIVAMSLSGCESMREMRDSISSIDFPYFGDPDTETSEKISADEDGILMAKTDGCPQVAVVEDLKSLTQFETPSKPTPGTKISAIALTGITSSCTMNRNTVAVDIGLRFDGHLGPQAAEWKTANRSFAYPYFIAVTTQSGEIISKEVFAATITYEGDETALTQQESIRQVIPVRDDKAIDGYEILVGFQLTDDELNYSRMMVSKPSEAAPKPKKKASKAKAKKATTEPVSVTPPEDKSSAVETTPVGPTPFSAVPTTEDVIVEKPVEQAAPVTAETIAEPVKAETTMSAPSETAPVAIPGPAVSSEVQGPVQPPVPAAVNPYAPPPTQVITIKPDGTVEKN